MPDVNFLFTSPLSSRRILLYGILRQAGILVLASLFLLMAAYYRAEMPNSTAHYRRYAFFSQMALFCCMLCLTDGEWMFYLSAGIWMASDFCALPAYTGRYE